MATVLETKPLTAEEFLNMNDGGACTELVRGRVVEMNRPHTAHGYFMMRIAFILQQYLQEHDIGRIGGGDAGVVTERNPDSVRGPDVAFYSYERIPRGPLPKGYWPASPELVIEVRSSDDRWKDIFAKAVEYQSAGVLTVAVADPQTQQIHLFSAERGAVVLETDDELAFPDILPGFAVVVHKLFE